MSHYKPYPAYKDSVGEWLGKAPEHWIVSALKYSVRLDGGAGFPEEEQGLDDAPVPFFKVADLVNGMLTADNYISVETAEKLRAKIFPSGTIAFAKVGAALLLNRRVLMKVAGCVDNNMMVALPLSLRADWLFYFLSTFDMGSLVNPGAVPSVNQEQVGNIKIACPTSIEQASIATHLDRETTRIDALIAKKIRFIELLKEKRQALITQAVTKGLDPNVKMKDSGVQWLGEVPEHWAASPIKYLTTHIGSGKTPSGGSEVYQQSGVQFLRSQNIYEDGLRLEDVAYITDSTDEEMKASRVKPLDVLLNITGASIGRSCQVPESFPSANVNQHVCIIRTYQADLSKWLSLCFPSQPAQSQIDLFQNGAGREGLNFEQIGKMVIGIPPREESGMIATHLDRETTRIDTLVQKTQLSITLLKERRSALITAAVTGQIDLRERVYV
jgi:type I restriction enzyme S subunit